MSTAFLAIGCYKEDEKDIDNGSSECLIDMDTFDLAFGIDYSQPDLYLIPGQQSALSDSFFNIVHKDLGQIAEGMTGVKQVCNWINANFDVTPAGGALIGRFDVNELFEKRLIFGCHSNALVQIGILRKAGYPSIMVETASVSWIEAYNRNEATYYSGHVMAEVFVDDHWILLENNGLYVDDYLTNNPYISHDFQHNGYLIYARGRDMWEYGVFTEEDVHNLMKETASNYGCFEEYIGSNFYRWR